jgi:hypothetical protein
VDSLDVIKVCLRRWYAFLPIVIIAAGAGVGLSKQLRPTYTATGSYAFVYTHPEAVQPNAADPRNQNPLVAGGSTALLGEAVKASLSSDAMQEALGGNNRGYPADEEATPTHYSVTMPEQSASYVVQTWADSAKEAADVVQAVLKSSPQSARDAQERAGAPELSRYTTFVTAATQTTELPPPSSMKLLLTLIAIGGVAGAGASLLVDRLWPKRARSRRTRHPRPAGGRLLRTRPPGSAFIADKPVASTGRRLSSGERDPALADDVAETSRETVTP